MFVIYSDDFAVWLVSLVIYGTPLAFHEITQIKGAVHCVRIMKSTTLGDWAQDVFNEINLQLSHEVGWNKNRMCFFLNIWFEKKKIMEWHQKPTNPVN